MLAQINQKLSFMNSFKMKMPIFLYPYRTLLKSILTVLNPTVSLHLNLILSLCPKNKNKLSGFGIGIHLNLCMGIEDIRNKFLRLFFWKMVNKLLAPVMMLPSGFGILMSTINLKNRYISMKESIPYSLLNRSVKIHWLWEVILAL